MWGLPTWDHGARLQDALDDTERVMQGAVHLVQHVVVGAPEQHGDGLALLAALDDHHLIVCNRLLCYLRGAAM